MDEERKFEPYKMEQIEKGESLPERLSSVEHDIEVTEGLKIDKILEQTAQTNEAIAAKTNVDFHFSGSIGMYLMFNELRGEGRELMALEQRIAGGKNDTDVTVSAADRDRLMNDLDFDEESKAKMRGGVAGAKHAMVDIQTREPLPSFPAQTIEYQGQEIKVQSPEQMIFDKIRALTDPGRDDITGEQRGREVKWGVDIKLLMAYLIEKNDWTETDLEEHLEQKWDKYIEEQTNQRVEPLVEQKRQGRSNERILKSVLASASGQESIENVEDALQNVLGSESQDLIHDLLAADSPEDFGEAVKKALAKTSYRPQPYKEAAAKAEREYQKLISN